jgi:hypothetical protein
MPHVKITLVSIDCLSTTDTFLTGREDELHCRLENRPLGFYEHGGIEFRTLHDTYIGDFGITGTSKSKAAAVNTLCGLGLQ